MWSLSTQQLLRGKEENEKEMSNVLMLSQC